MLKLLVPIFTRLVYNNHRFDITISVYIQLLNQFMSVKGIDSLAGIVSKFEILKSNENDFEKLAHQFMEFVDAEY